MESLRQKVITLATSIASQNSETSGKDYYDCISDALDKACEKLGVGKKEFIRIFLY